MNAQKKQKGSLYERKKGMRVTGSDEQRNYIRTNVYVPMFLYLQGAKQDNKIAARTRNISASGMMIELDQDIPVGSQARIDIIPVDASNPVHCSGKIVWSVFSESQSKFNCGVEFIAIEEDNKNTFLKFLCDLIYKTGTAE